MGRYHGKAGAVYGSTTAAGVATLIASLSGWTLNMATDKVDVSAFGDTNKVYVQGLKDITGTLSGWYDDSESDLFTGADSADGVKLYLYVASTAATKYAYGTAWLDVSMDVKNTGAASISANFVAAGSWGIRL